MRRAAVVDHAWLLPCAAMLLAGSRTAAAKLHQQLLWSGCTPGPPPARRGPAIACAILEPHRACCRAGDEAALPLAGGAADE